MSLSAVDRYELQQMQIKLADLRFELALIRLALKAGFNPSQPQAFRIDDAFNACMI